MKFYVNENRSTTVDADSPLEALQLAKGVFEKAGDDVDYRINVNKKKDRQEPIFDGDFDN